MKKDIHPKTSEVVAECTCGFSMPVRTIAKSIKVTLCSNCHPFYTGDQKFVDTAGRIEKFQKKFKKN